MQPRSSLEFYRSQQRLAVLTVAAARRAWSGMGADFDRSWAVVGPRLVVISSAAQLGSARAGSAYVPRVLAETNQDDLPDAEVNPRGFVGFAADGRSLDGLLYGAVVESKAAVGNGATPDLALAQGGRWLDMAVQTLVADAGRGSTGLGCFTRNTGYVRMLNPPSCSRCAVLAGKWFESNAGFDRHPRCDCVHIPAAEDIAGDFLTNPDQAAREGHVTDLTAAQKRAVADGADLSQIVNARRGMTAAGETQTVTRMTNVRLPDGSIGRELRTVNVTTRHKVGDGLITTEGTTTRGIAGKRLGLGRLNSDRSLQRLTPEGIYARAGDDRAEALRLLKQHGYVI